MNERVIIGGQEIRVGMRIFLAREPNNPIKITHIQPPDYATYHSFYQAPWYIRGRSLKNNADQCITVCAEYVKGAIGIIPEGVEWKPKFLLEDYPNINTAMYVHGRTEAEIFQTYLRKQGIFYEQIWSGSYVYFHQNYHLPWEQHSPALVDLVLRFNDFDWSEYDYLDESKTYKSKPKPMTLEELDKLLEEERNHDM